MKLSLLTWIYTPDHGRHTQFLIGRLVTANTVTWPLGELANANISREEAAGHFGRYDIFFKACVHPPFF